MAVIAADLISYLSANMPEDDTSTSGGAILTTGKPDFTPLASNATLEALSDNAGDTTQTLTITGRDSGGVIQGQGLTLNGVTPVIFSTLGAIERMLKSVLSAGTTGTVTIRVSPGGATVATLGPGLTSVRRMFYDSASETGATTRFEKIFYKNTNGTDSLSNAKVTLTADPAASLRIGVAASKDDSGTTANRKTDPSVTYVDDSTAQSVPTGALAAGEAIGIWCEMSRSGGAAAVKDTFTIQLSGTTV